MHTLKKDFATYIKKFGLNNVKLYGPQGDEFECKLQLRILKRSLQKLVKVGKISLRKIILIVDVCSTLSLSTKKTTM
jgi:hypothetical protein